MRATLVARHEVDHVVKIALLLGVRGRILSREDAHQPHVVGAVAHDLEGLHEPREAIALDGHLLFDLGRRQRGSRILRRRRVGGSRFGALTFGGALVDGAGAGTFIGAVFRDRRGLAFGRCRLRRRLRGALGGSGRFLDGGRSVGGHRLGVLSLGALGNRDLSGFAAKRFGAKRFGAKRFGAKRFGAKRLGLRRLFGRCLGGGRRSGASRTMGTANERRLAQDGAGELGDGLHWASI
jgi:hypothetical protein